MLSKALVQDLLTIINSGCSGETKAVASQCPFCKNCLRKRLQEALDRRTSERQGKSCTSSCGKEHEHIVFGPGAGSDRPDGGPPAESQQHRIGLEDAS